MYTQIKVAKLVMNLNLVLPGLTGWLVWRLDTLALHLAKVDLISGYWLAAESASVCGSMMGSRTAVVQSTVGRLSAL